MGQLDTAYFQSALAALAENNQNLKRLTLYEGRRSNINEGGMEVACIGLFDRGILKRRMIDDTLGHIYDPQNHSKKINY